MGDTENSEHLMKRLMELKELYKMQKEQLGDYTIPKRQPSFTDSVPSSRNGSSEEESQSDDEKRGNLRNKEPVYNDTLDAEQLLAVIKQVIIDHGGSCHLHTMSEYVRLRWPNQRKRDGSLYNVNDCRKATQNCLKNHSNTIFMKDYENENCWTIFKADNDKEKDMKQEKTNDNKERVYDTQSNLVAQYLEDKGGTATYEELSQYVVERFARKSGSLPNEDLTDEEIKEAVKITLNTNPRFKFKKEKKNVYSLAPVKKRKDRVGDDTTVKRRKRSELDLVDMEVEISDEESKTGRSRRSSARNKRASSPPPGFVCKCGATTPGKGPTCKWRKGSSPGEWLCNSCGLQTAKKKEQVKEDANPWIRCDDCHRWLRAKDDNIEDISIYDDANPDHLDYYCPRCRKKKRR